MSWLLGLADLGGSSSRKRFVATCCYVTRHLCLGSGHASSFNYLRNCSLNVRSLRRATDGATLGKDVSSFGNKRMILVAWHSHLFTAFFDKGGKTASRFLLDSPVTSAAYGPKEA
ncbi:hypothetical protein IW261DRAFT_1593497 [Armillaria novae-zelandiae]|uniref:Uncharacterized protein n=1 Tax=Armillaria novae-zelandiae TaxID=153914 RepID=A0AA39PAK4_9AGAR|nr:hypothetical protein IW261DRAFT_1593497 [Armillaria novae-zelandiae]